MEINCQIREKEHIERICRLCMAKNANVAIFPDINQLKSDRELPIVCKIMSTVNIQIKKDDGLPSHICENCASQVEETYEFLRLCEMSDSFLRQYLDFGHQISWIFRYSELLRMISSREQFQSRWRLGDELPRPEEEA